MAAYDRAKALAYARRWAFDRNPRFGSFNGIGGDCTNFISQIIYAGSGVMNYTPNTGWYFISMKKRAPAWTGVEFLYRFLVNNKGPGPYGRLVAPWEAELADIIQLSFDGEHFGHSLAIVSIQPPGGIYDMTIATHSNDAYDRPVSSYNFQKYRVIHIEGVRP